MPLQYLNKKTIGLVGGPLAFLLIMLFFKPADLSEQGVAVLATTCWVAIWWVTETIPIEVTALLPILLFPLSGGLSLPVTGASYGHKFIFLFICFFKIFSLKLILVFFISNFLN